MIRIPYCLKCDNCKENMVCEAYPEGIPKEILHMPKLEGTLCNNRVPYKKHIEENQISAQNATSQK